MAMLLLIPAVALAFSTLGAAITAVWALRFRPVEVPKHLFWVLTTGAGAIALVLMAMGRPA